MYIEDMHEPFIPRENKFKYEEVWTWDKRGFLGTKLFDIEILADWTWMCPLLLVTRAEDSTRRVKR